MNANAPSAAATADPDGDGLSNLLEFLLLSDPNAPSPQALPVAAREGSSFTLTFHRRVAAAAQSGISAQVEWADDLAGPWTTAGVTEQTLSTSGDTAHIKATVPPGGPRQFVRLNASLTPPG